MAKLTDFELIENVLISIYRIAYYSENLTDNKLNEDPKSSDAIKYCLLQLGKNISKISKEFQQNYTALSGIDWALLAMFKMDGYFLDEELWEVINDEERGVLSYFDDIETIYLKERQKPENKEIAVIPAKFFKKDDTLLLKKKQHKTSSFDNLSDKSKGFNPRNHITSHSSIWTLKKK
jgi:uncharacterized protein with HEPN domain